MSVSDVGLSVNDVGLAITPDVRLDVLLITSQSAVITARNGSKVTVSLSAGQPLVLDGRRFAAYRDSGGSLFAYALPGDPPTFPSAAPGGGGAPNSNLSTPVSGSSAGASPGKMAGCGLTLTPVNGNPVLVWAKGKWEQNAGGGSAGAQLAYGTGTPPVAGAAKTGTLVGDSPNMPIGTTLQLEFSLLNRISGLTAGTGYWFDMVLTAAAAQVADNLVILAKEDAA